MSANLDAQASMAPLLERQQTVAIVLAVAILVLVLELVRRRKLREEYSWVWVAVSMLLLALSLQDGLIGTISDAIGSATATSTLFFGAILFLMLLTLQFSVRLSRLTHRQRTMAQRLTLLENELERLRAATPPPAEILPLRAPPPPVAGTAPMRSQDGMA
ncbi:MAG: DUF2304 domain-containing protein [Planctomycetota bacterium]